MTAGRRAAAGQRDEQPAGSGSDRSRYAVAQIMPGTRDARRTDGRVDHSQMRSANMGLILRHLRTVGGRSRARLSVETGLSKATMSSLIADLTERGLVREGDVERDGAVGRPGLTVRLDGRTVCGIGVEINVDFVAITAVDLAGNVVREVVTPLDSARLPLDTVLDRLAAGLRRVIESLQPAGFRIAGVTISPPGVIDDDAGVVRFAPNLGWRAVPLVSAIAGRLAPLTVPIRLENDAKLAAVAEYAGRYGSDVQDLLYLTGDVGVGAGIIAGGRLLRGWSGFSGEVGHLPLDPAGTPCNCGRTGCWETIIGLHALFRLVSSDAEDHGRAVEDRLSTLRERALAGDARVLTALATITADLARGLSILVDVLNPRVVVLGGWFAFFGEFILGPLGESLAARRMDEGSQTTLTVSELGLTAAARGGAHLALETIFVDPSQVDVLA